MPPDETLVQRIEREINALWLLFKRRRILAVLIILGLGITFLPKVILEIQKVTVPKTQKQIEKVEKEQPILIPKTNADSSSDKEQTNLPTPVLNPQPTLTSDLKLDFEGLKVGDCLENYYAGGSSRIGFRTDYNPNIKETMPCPGKETVIANNVINGKLSYSLGWLQFERSNRLKFPKNLSLDVKKKPKSNATCNLSVLTGPKRNELSLRYDKTVDSTVPHTHRVSLPSSESIVMIRAICGDLIVDDIVFSKGES